jgi:hypothetical protein
LPTPSLSDALSEMLSDDVQVFDHVPYRIDGRPLFAQYLNG